MNKQASLKSYLSIQKDLHQGKGQKRTQPPLLKDAIKKQKMINNFDKIQLLSPEKTPFTSPQKIPTIPSKFSKPSKFYEIDKKIDSPIKSPIKIKSTQNLYQTQIDSYTKKNPITISDSESESESENEIKNVIDYSKINKECDIWEKEKEKNVPIIKKETHKLEELKKQNVEDFIKDIFNSTEQIKNKNKKEQEIKQIKPQLPEHEIKLKAGISSIDLSKNIIPLLLSERKLNLPEKYEKLQKLFEALDHILRYDKALNRQSVLFTNLIKRLENICHCKVTNKQLGQIMKVYPESYYLRAFRAKDGNVNWYIDFNNSASALNQAFQAGKLADIRRKTFRQNLLNYVYKEYDKFLIENGKSKITDYSQLNKWDPEFDLNNCPDIEPVELPSPPLYKNQIDIEKKLIESKPREPNPLIKKADIALIKEKQNNKMIPEKLFKTEIKSTASNNISSVTSDISNSSTSKSIISSTSDSKQISSNTSISESKTRGEAREKISALRLRLREKDRLRKLKQQQTPTEVRKNALIGRLPDIVRTLKKYYVSKKTTSLPYNEVKSMLQISCTINSFSGVDEHIKLLTEVNIECCRKVPTVNYGTYLKFFPEKVDDTLRKIEEMKANNKK